MPEHPQNLVLPQPPLSGDPEDMRRWAESLITILGNAWQGMVYVLNALSTTGLLADLPAEPEINHIFYTATDTGQVFVGVEGAWIEVGPAVYGANGQSLAIRQITELHTLAAATTSDTTIEFPAGSLGLGVSYLVTTTITGATTFDLGVAGATDRYFDDAALTGDGAIARVNEYAAGTPLRFTANGADFTGGVVRVVAYYLLLAPPDS